MHSVYPAFRVWFVLDLIPDSPIRNHWRFLLEPSKDTNLIYTDLSVMHLSLYTVRAFWRIYSGSFSLKSTQVVWLTISWSLCGCSWWFADGYPNNEFDEFRIVYREQFVEIRNWQFICANHAQCIIHIMVYVVTVRAFCLGVILQNVSFFISQPGLTENWLNMK